MPDNICRGDLGSKERELYGQNNWYDWSLANWGTKWNAYGYDEIKNNNPKEKITFLTAWAAPHPIMEKLAEMYPEVNIQHEWADEDIGMNCGRYCIPKGLYCYHLRQSDDGERFAALENIVAVNHGGSVITKEHIKLGEKGYISLNEDIEPNFLGETTTIKEYFQDNAELSEDMGMEMSQI